MARTSATQPRRKPSPTDAVVHETHNVVRLAVYGLLAIFVLVPLLPSLIGTSTRQVVDAAVPTADEMTCWPTAPLCPPGPAGGWRGRSPADTTPTTPPTSVPYGPPNGPVRPLPSQLQAPSAPPARGNLPELGGPTGGGLLGELPAIGPVVAGGLKALGPGLKALTAP